MVNEVLGHRLWHVAVLYVSFCITLGATNQLTEVNWEFIIASLIMRGKTFLCNCTTTTKDI